MPSEKIKHRDIFLTVFFLLSVFILALIKIEDNDAWMHLGFGRLIFELRGLPDKEPFVYPSFDRPFLYTSWLFSLVYYAAYLALKIHGVILMKALTVTAAFYILVRDSLKPYGNHFVAIAVLSLAAIMTRHRFVERPDTFLMIFLPFSIFCLNAFLFENKKYIYALPLVHMVWANCHSSIGLMFIPFLAFIAGGVLQYGLGRKGINFLYTPSIKQLKTILMIFILSFAATLVNPDFINQYFYGAHVMGTAWYKQQILELRPPGPWISRWLYIEITAVILTFVLNIRRFSFIHFFMIVPFIFLPFTAVRFIVLLGITGGPIAARNLSSFFRSLALDSLFHRKAFSALLVLWMALYSSLALAYGTPLESGRKKFGFGINYSVIPEGALRFMDKNRIQGRILNHFNWGGYITWRDYPERTVFIDPRGYLEPALLEKLSLARHRPAVLDELYKKYGFQSILMPNEKIITIDTGYDTDAALLNTDWALVYWDDVSLLYLKKDGKYSQTVKKYEYRYIKPANRIEGLRSRLTEKDFRGGVIRELKRNIDETGSSLAHVYLGYVYNEIGLYKEAINLYSGVVGERPLSAYSGIAFACNQLNDTGKALLYYKKALNLNDEDANLHYNTGLVYLKERDAVSAERHFLKALKIDNGLMPVYQMLINIYEKTGRSEDARKIKNKYRIAGIRNNAGAHFRAGMDAYLGKDYDKAETELKKAIELNPSNPALYSNLGYVYFDMGMTDKSFTYQKKAAEINPEYANAYYGLAQIYEKWGDMQTAGHYYKEYIRIEPSGYYSRKAMRKLQELK